METKSMVDLRVPLNAQVLESIPKEYSLEHLLDESGSLALRLLIDKSLLGRLIGKRGATISAIRQACHDVTVNIANDGDRVVTVSGSGRGVLGAVHVIAYAVSGTCEQWETTLLVPASTVGGFIGVKGALVKQTRQVSGCSVRIGSTCYRGSKDKLVTVRGDAPSLFIALAIMLEQLMECVERVYGQQGSAVLLSQSRTHPKSEQCADIHGQDTRTDESRPGSWRSPSPSSRTPSEAEADAASSSDEPDTLVLELPANKIGAVIGKGGARIKSIREQSQCMIRIDSVNPGAAIRRVTVVGPDEQQSVALRLIREALSGAPGRK